MSQARRIVLLGAPGSGKGTQAELLAVRQGLSVIATGARLRQEVASGSLLGKRVAQVMASGGLVDDELISEVVASAFDQMNRNLGFVLDGYPRTAPQVEALDRMLERLGTALERVVLLEVPEEELVRRLMARGRSDDGEAVVRERLRVYTEQTEPLVELYEKRSLLRRVDGLGEIGAVAERIERALEH